MNMKYKTFVIIATLLCFSASLFAKPITYSFSAFGGGLPSSAKLTKASDNSGNTVERIIITEEDEIEETEEAPDFYYDEPEVKKSKKVALITTYVVLGVVVVAGIAFGATYLSNESAQCCEESSDEFFQNCGDGCAEGCGEAIGESCGESLSQSCSESTSSSCTTNTLSSMFNGGLKLIPVFIP